MNCKLLFQYKPHNCVRKIPYLKQTWASTRPNKKIKYYQTKKFAIKIKKLYSIQASINTGIQRTNIQGTQLIEYSLFILQFFQVLAVCIAIGCFVQLYRQLTSTQNISGRETDIKQIQNEKIVKQTQNSKTSKQTNVSIQQQIQPNIQGIDTKIIMQSMLLLSIICSVGIGYLKDILYKQKWLELLRKYSNFLGIQQVPQQNDDVRNQVVKDQIRIKVIKDELRSCNQQLNLHIQQTQEVVNNILQKQEDCGGKMNDLEESINRLSLVMSKQIGVLQHTLQQLQEVKK
eukprot:TRINITY_DN3000_c0_g1_i21.p2 TRINITY_DN3000_c0_g1~~TRINITY_DN3000_c0_g1_i21.p2  ORF type:complete len:288 (-),score=8.05 TRINITY_DN3000_c0_g1_i21:267-1130(-)